MKLYFIIAYMIYVNLWYTCVPFIFERILNVVYMYALIHVIVNFGLFIWVFALYIYDLNSYTDLLSPLVQKYS